MSFQLQIWNRVLQEDELRGLSQCSLDVSAGRVVTWPGSEDLWHLSNITIEKFEKGANVALCGASGCSLHNTLNGLINLLCRYFYT